MLLCVESPAGWLIDWRSFTGTGDMSIGEFLETRPEKPVLLLVMAQRFDYFNGAFSEPERHLCLRLTDETISITSTVTSINPAAPQAAFRRASRNSTRYSASRSRGSLLQCRRTFPRKQKGGSSGRDCRRQRRRLVCYPESIRPRAARRPVRHPEKSPAPGFPFSPASMPSAAAPSRQRLRDTEAKHCARSEGRFRGRKAGGCCCPHQG